MHTLSRSRLEQGSLCCLLLLGCIVGVWLSLRQMLPEVLQTALLRQQLFPWLLLEMAGFLLCSGFAAGSKGNAVALEPVLLLCVSSAVGRKYAALSAAVSGAVCSDTGIIWRIVIALSGAAKIAGSVDINKGTLEHRTT